MVRLLEDGIFTKGKHEGESLVNVVLNYPEYCEGVIEVLSEAMKALKRMELPFAIFEDMTMIKKRDLSIAIKDYLEKSGYSIVDMDRAVASVERLILVRLDDIMERIWDEVDDDPDFLQSCDFDE